MILKYKNKKIFPSHLPMKSNASSKYCFKFCCAESEAGSNLCVTDEDVLEQELVDADDVVEQGLEGKDVLELEDANEAQEGLFDRSSDEEHDGKELSSLLADVHIVGSAVQTERTLFAPSKVGCSASLPLPR